jgi:hypothetical protein
MSDDIDFLKDEISRLRKSLSELTPTLEALLARRGFKIYKKEPSDDLLLPDELFIDDFYENLKKYSFRLFLRDVIKHQKLFRVNEVAKYPSRAMTEEYISLLLKFGLAEPFEDGYRLLRCPVRSFGETLEWFIAEIMKRDLRAEAIWGIKFKRPSVGGDYDLISKFDSSILYMEIKSSPPKQIYDREISAFIDRVEDLCPEIAVFFVDTELRMKDKIVLMFEAELLRRHKAPKAVERLKGELFHIDNRIFIINAKPDIPANIVEVLRAFWRKNLIG